MSWSALAPFALLGLAGSLHCAGMCGPLALSLALGRGRAGPGTVAGYLVGKAAMYSALALLAARGVAELGARQPEWLALSRGALAWAAGVVMLVVALSSLGWLRFSRLGFLSPLERALRAALRAADELPGPLRGLAFGAANGLLPCGLSWSAIALGAASTELVVAALGPFAFGLATGPVLASIAAGGASIPLAWRVRGQRLAALALLCYGGWMIARGFAPLAPESAAKVLPECCTEEALEPAHEH